MFAFVKRDEGMMVYTGDQEGVANVDCATISFVDNPEMKFPQKVVTNIPREKWAIHFTGRKFNPEELAAFVEELAEQEF